MFDAKVEKVDYLLINYLLLIRLLAQVQYLKNLNISLRNLKLIQVFDIGIKKKNNYCKFD